MNQPVGFAEVLDAVDALSAEDQVTLVDIVSHRLAEEGRKRVVADVRQSRQEYAEGRCRPITVDELRDEMLP
jgi:hypothetical protein